jgi:hypothetical protein
LPSAFASTVSPRDRRALTRGGIAAALVVAMAWALPTVRRKAERERDIAAAADGLARVLGAVQQRESIASRVAVRDAGRQMLRLPVAAPSLAQGAALVHESVRALADSSQLTVVQVETPDTSEAIAVQLVATGDVFGVAEFLERIQRSTMAMGIRALRVERLAGQRTAAGDERLQLTVTLSAPWSPTP